MLHQEVLGRDGYGPCRPLQKARVGSYAPLPHLLPPCCPQSPEPKHLLLLAVNADQPPFQVTAGEPGLDPLLGALAKIVALLLEMEPVLGTYVACGSWGHTLNRGSGTLWWVMFLLQSRRGLGWRTCPVLPSLKPNRAGLLQIAVCMESPKLASSLVRSSQPLTLSPQIPQ